MGPELDVDEAQELPVLVAAHLDVVVRHLTKVTFSNKGTFVKTCSLADPDPFFGRGPEPDFTTRCTTISFSFFHHSPYPILTMYYLKMTGIDFFLSMKIP